jgi:hypothetical protein
MIWPVNKPSRFPVKERVTFIVSIAAFVFSALSIIFNVSVALRKTDDLKLYVREISSAERTGADSIRIANDDLFLMIFTNAGNRPALVLHVVLLVNLYASPPEERCAIEPAVNGYVVFLDVKPLIIKQDDIVQAYAKMTQVRDAESFAEIEMGTREKSGFEMHLPESVKTGKDPTIQYCLSIMVGTPSRLCSSQMFLIAEQKIADGGRLGHGSLTVEEAQRPRILIPRTLSFQF